MLSNALLTLEDGRAFPCRSFTGPGQTSGEVVFNTSMTGYQEILTDPSYCGQLVTLTYPLIGNYGVNPEDIESDRVHAVALLVREYQDFSSNFRSAGTLKDYLNKYKVMGLEGIDTRALTRHIRNQGVKTAYITTNKQDMTKGWQHAKAVKPMQGQDLAGEVTTTVPYFWRKGSKVVCQAELTRKVWPENKPGVLAFDFGIKFNILRYLEACGFEILVVPATTTADMVRKLQPDGIFLSNGPGDPQAVAYAVETIRDLIGYRPMFGICLGLQIMGIAMGGRTFKLKFGHRGGNQPVKNLLNGRIEITSQNHGFAVDMDSLKNKEVQITHLNLNDQTVEGFRHLQHPFFGVQYHPEASPGPHDADYLFNEFKKLIRT